MKRVWDGLPLQMKHAIGALLCYYYRVFKFHRTFTFQGKTFQYFYYPFPMTCMGERAVEIPIVWAIVNEYRGKRILEVGNVLSQYFPVTHDVLDKYDQANWVIKEDVVDFKPGTEYDLIVSISTLEHVGWDEIPREPAKIVTGFENLVSLLSDNGSIIATFPVGHNPELDRLLENGTLELTRAYYLKRITRDNRWVEVGWRDIRGCKYGEPYSFANGLVIGVAGRLLW